MKARRLDDIERVGAVVWGLFREPWGGERCLAGQRVSWDLLGVVPQRFSDDREPAGGQADALGSPGDQLAR